MLYRLEMTVIRREKGPSLTQCASYISGETLTDPNGKICSCTRKDVAHCQIWLPENAPFQLYNLQELVNAMEQAEHRKDSRTGRGIKVPLPNELSLKENLKILEAFVKENVLTHGLCVIAAIHNKLNIEDPSKNNPHAHCILSTRSVGSDGFSRVKARESNKLEYLIQCREAWARETNEAYARNGYSIRVDHRSLRDQGIDRKPVNHLTRLDWEREQRGERTLAGDRRREIEKQNEDHERPQQYREHS